MFTVSLTEDTGIFALRNLAVPFTSEINVFFIVLFISQLLVGAFFPCLSLIFNIVNLVIYTVIWSAESGPAFAFILNCVLRL